VIDLLFIAGALIVTAILSATQLGTDSRDGYVDDHQR
jgi:hypothetical protein